MALDVKSPGAFVFFNSNLVDYGRMIVGETVRRERRWTSAGATPARGTGSLHPEAIEAAAEATKLSELSV